MSTEGPQKSVPLYKRRWFVVVVAIVVILLVVSLIPYALPSKPATREQVELNRAIAYLGASYNITVGLEPSVANGSAYTLYPDNYLAVLAASRYSTTNTTTMDFALALYTALKGYAATLPARATQSAYTALNSTTAAFGCPRSYALGWSRGTGTTEAGAATLETVSNDGSDSCASQNYASLYFLQSLWWYKDGNQSEALRLFADGASDFDGKGIEDIAFSSLNSTSYGLYQTSELALFVYTTSCLGQSGSNPTYNGAVATLMSLQDNSTGAFYVVYNSALTPANSTVSTGTTAMAMLALERVNSPSSPC